MSSRAAAQSIAALSASPHRPRRSRCLSRRSRCAQLTATLLEVGIRRRSDATVFWEGRAVSEARTGSAEAASTAAVERLAGALFRDFPGESGRTIRVR
jgi:hypothetical protein